LIAGSADLHGPGATQPIPAFAEKSRPGRSPRWRSCLPGTAPRWPSGGIDTRVRRLEWVGLVQPLSPALKEALLAAEDKRFFEHSGVDWRALAGSLWHNLWYDRKRGASTLSMQLAGLLDPELALGYAGAPRRSIGQKWDQALAAQALENRWTKEQILEAYLNLAPFRGDLQGVHAASPAILFGKTPGRARPAQGGAASWRRCCGGPNAKAEPWSARRACLLADQASATRRPCAARSTGWRTATARSATHIGPLPGSWRRTSRRQLLQQPGQRLDDHPRRRRYSAS
jgi:penicillin-binding protein 1C